MTTLRDDIASALSMTGQRWYAGLAEPLATSVWADLAFLGIDPNTYGTSRVLKCDGTAPREVVMLPNAGWHRPLLLEGFDEAARARYGLFGLRERPLASSIGCAEALFSDAINIIDRVPAAGVAVRTLVWSISILQVDDAGYDISHSDPEVPFSVFVGLHEPIGSTPAIRLAESLLHESMHLQLSLIEREMPLVRSAAHHAHSPWQGRPRPTQGLLHGAYVFRVIQDWLQGCLASGLSAHDASHAEGRITQIEDECDELAALSTSEDLTPAGRILAQALTQ